MGNLKEKVKSLHVDELFEISEYVLCESILLSRNLSFAMLGREFRSDEANSAKDDYLRCLIDLADISHNIPSYLKHKNTDGLKTELLCLMRFFNEKLLHNHELIRDMNAYTFIHYFESKGFIEN